MQFQQAFQNLALALLLLAPLWNCATRTPGSVNTWDSQSEKAQRKKIADDAHFLKGKRQYHFSDKKFSYDCSGYIAGILHLNGFDLHGYTQAQSLRGNGVLLLYEFIKQAGVILPTEAVPQKGDVLFFSNTYDRNRDGKNNDAFTHIGIVTQVDRDGQLQFLHHMQGHVQRGHIHLRHTQAHNESKELVNSYLRRRKKGDPPNTRYLAHELLVAVGSVVTATKRQTASKGNQR